MRDWKTIVGERLAALGLEGTAEADLKEELSQHLEDRYRELCHGGMAEEQAYQMALVELQNMESLRASSKRTPVLPKQDDVPLGSEGRGNLIEHFWRDLRYASRMVKRSPAFVGFVVLTLALGIGANTTVFTVINTLLLNPLPVPDSGALQSVSAAKLERNSKSQVPLPISYADLIDLRSSNTVFQSLAGYTGVRVVTWQAGSGSQRMFTELVTGNYFSTLQLKPAAGRYFFADEDSVPGAHPVAVLNYGTWQGSFGGAADIIGKEVRLDGVTFTIIGIAPPHFIGMNGVFGPDFWIPATMAETLMPNEMNGVFTDRAKAVFLAVGRFKPQVTQAQAGANVSTVAANLARDYPVTDQDRTLVVRPVRDVLFASSVGSSSSIVFAGAGLLGVVGIVLLIACSNVANLLLARSAGRQQEIAVRFAMGASRAGILRQLLTESMLFALLSGVAGLLVGYAGLHFLFAMLPSGANFVEPKFDTLVFLYALVISLATGFLFGIMPALRTSDEEARTMGRSRKRVSVGNGLLVGQVALSFLLLVIAALFLRSIGRAYGMDPGFQTAHLATFMASPGQSGYKEPEARAFYKEALERTARIPGVGSAAWASNLPLWARAVNGMRVEGREQGTKNDTISTILDIVGLNYFETAGVTIENGREFNAIDRKDTAPVAIVNEQIATSYWPDGSALGKRIQLPGETFQRQIVGIARNANYTNWGEAVQPCVCVPLEQSYADAMTLWVRSKGDPTALIKPVEEAMRTAGPHILISGSRTGRQILDGGLFGARVGVALLTVFGLLALGLASVGLYGLLAYAVNQRRREIGLRMALGAARGSVLALILKQGMTLVLTGVVIGFAAALVVGRLLSRLLYGVSGADPISLAGAAVILLSISLLASYLPARGASRVDPLVALREG